MAHGSLVFISFSIYYFMKTSGSGAEIETRKQLHAVFLLTAELRR